ncbi:MAG: hypothetical protein A2664_02410 [Candidatus Taylorbacteria bacterium RIFCSPHIGHO2_01_FULL_46_22b]|uniref:DoxX family protein n=1 Tax=Candidatus Taylorbacteria bacterium RIFCSPHIGHO2_01_FULL_46_22b TaxID=1802301 RepID=A0A1G2M5E6_9BACT|nr:MAG: hypothetical protein A2664_02410 [Candidatus Taylorbacteria bacterium RIFCSPHIGHO2_01_FULL_46_22b]
MNSSEKLTSFLLRAGLAVVFLYAATASLFDPMAWAGFMPQFFKDLVPVTILLTAFSIFEILLSLWLLSGIKPFGAAVIASLALCGIILATISLFDIVFRDIAILFAALALGTLHYKRSTV